MLRWLLGLVTLGVLILLVAQNVHFSWEPKIAEKAQTSLALANAPRPVGISATQSSLSPALPLMIPVAGVKPYQLVDTYTQTRAAGARTHNAIDIVAPAGTPVIAATAGRIEKLFFSEQGGNTIYQRSIDGKWMYYYAHLDTYQSGLSEGMIVRAGDQIATVGATGNADQAAPHLHFAVNAMAAHEKWFQGTPVNPYPLMMAH